MAALILLSSMNIFKSFWQRKKLPPGPKPWPVIGNINLLGSSPHKSFHSLSKKYGDIMLVWFGKFPVVVASSPHMAKQFLKVHDSNFASRPALAAGKYTTYDYLFEIFSAKKLELFHQVRVEEGRSLLNRLHGLSGKPVVLREHLTHYTLSNICRMLLGSKYFSETRHDHDESPFKLGELQGMYDEWFLLNGVINIGDWIPWLRFLDVQGYVKRMKDLHKKLDRFNEFVIGYHQSRKRTAEKNEFDAKGMAEMLLHLVEKRNLEVGLSRDCIKALLQDLIVGGTDTSASTVEWAILEVLRHPRLAEKAKEELDRVIGRNRWVEECDLSQLPYINAIVMESWRLYPLSPLLAPHCAINHCKVEGYDIPKGTVVLINTWSIGRDPNSWPDAPDEFLPERFLGKDIDVAGSNFGSGRRRCPGYKLGLTIARTTLANLLHGFELRLVEGMRPQDISVDELYGLTIRPKESLKVIMEPTLPTHLYGHAPSVLE